MSSLLAQTTTPTAATSTASTSASSTTDATLSEVVVTGSRLVTNGGAAPTPVTVVSQAQLNQLSPQSIPAGLQELPQFLGSVTPTTSSIANPTNANTATNLNLRNLGPQRVLTLFDGLRLPPSASNAYVDANLIPQLLVQRVDVVTGGASAAYGSDAVSGVINFVLDKKFEGLQFVAQDGFATGGGDGNRRLGVAAGTDLMSDNRLHVEGSAEYYTNQGIGAESDRPLGAARWAVVGENPHGIAGTPADPYIPVRNTYSTNDAFYGYFENGPLGGTEFNAAGQEVPFQGTNLGSGVCVACNGSYHDPGTISLIPKVQTDQYFGRADFNVTDTTAVFAQALYGHSVTSLDGSTAVERGGLTIFANNPYLPSGDAALIPATGEALAIQGIGLGDVTNDTVSKTWGASVGADGEIAERWKWDVDYSYGRSQQNINLYQLNNVHLQAALDAVTNPATGQIVCGVTLTNPGLYPGCQPLNVFGAGAASAGALAYIRGDGTQQSVFTQQVVEANIRGDLLDIWAGPISGAVGFAYRKDDFSQSSNSDPALPVAGTGIPGFTGLTYVTGNYGVGAGSESVKEEYLETLIPLAKDAPFAQSLNLDAAARFTDYSTSGSVTTWKVGPTWQLNDVVRFRATQSRDIRAPTLVELYQGVQPSAELVTDPVSGKSSDLTENASGNSGLKPEQADTTTIGFVFTPAHDLTLTLDWYNIRINDAIETPYTLQQIVTLCQAGNASLCGEITRPTPTSFPTAIAVTPLNVASIKTNGLDFESDYRMDAGPGHITTRLLATYVFSFEQQQAAGDVYQQYAGTAADYPGGPLPQFRGLATVAYDLQGFRIGLNERAIGEEEESRINSYLDNHIPAVFYTDADLSYSFPAGGLQLEAFAHVDNMFNKQPPLEPANIPGLIYPTPRGVYDIVGTALTFGIRGKF